MAADRRAISRISVDASVFDVAPQYRRVILLAELAGSIDGEGVGRALVAAHQAAEATIAGAGGEVGELPSIMAWREAFRSLGMNPSKFRPSVDALFRRIASGHVVQTGIPLVDIGTAASLAHVVPIGIHVIDGFSGGLALRPAGEGEAFTSLGGDSEPVDRGEIVWACGETVMTRRWVWRQGRFGSIDPERTPRLLAVNIDLIDGHDRGAVDATAELLRGAGAAVESVVELSAEQPMADL